MAPTKKSGFKPCRDCERQMSITDPQRICIWCLGSDVDGCMDCQSMNPKTLRERAAKMCLARSRRKKRRPRRSPSPCKSSSKSSKRHHHHRHRTSKTREKEPEKTMSVSPQQVSEEGELQIAERQSSGEGSSDRSHNVRLRRRRRQLCCTPPLSPLVKAPMPVTETGVYPALSAVGEDSAPFLNVMFSVFHRAMTPTRAPLGPVGPLQFVPLPGLQLPNPVLPWQKPSLRAPTPSHTPAPLGTRKIPAPDVDTASTTSRRSREIGRAS